MATGSGTLTPVVGAIGKLQYTKDDLLRHLRAFFRKFTEDGILTAHHDELINDSVTAAIIQVCDDFNLDEWRFNRIDGTASISSGVPYVDVTASTYSILSVIYDSLRITDPEIMLNVVTREQILANNPAYDAVGMPQLVAIERAVQTTANADAVRLYVWPVPDQSYTIAYSMTVAYNDEIETKIPSFVNTPLKSKSIEIAARWLQPNLVEMYRRLYDEDLLRHRTNNNSSKPRAIPNLHGIL